MCREPCVVSSAGGEGKEGVEACGSVTVTLVAGEVSLHVSLFIRFLFLLSGAKERMHEGATVALMTY